MKIGLKKPFMDAKYYSTSRCSNAFKRLLFILVNPREGFNVKSINFQGVCKGE